MGIIHRSALGVERGAGGESALAVIPQSCLERAVSTAHGLTAPALILDRRIAIGMADDLRPDVAGLFRARARDRHGRRSRAQEVGPPLEGSLRLGAIDASLDPIRPDPGELGLR